MPALRKTTTDISPRTNADGKSKLIKVNSVNSPKALLDATDSVKKETKSPRLMPANKGQDLATNVNLVEWTYDYFQNRYGLKNVADKKF